MSGMDWTRTALGAAAFLGLAAGVAFGVASIRTEDAKLTPSDAADLDRFGSAIAVSDDTVVVGAFGKDDLAGAAYVFTRSGAAWTQQAKLTTAHPFGQRMFGVAVALDGDRAIVGIPGPTVSAGSAEVFKRTGTAWAEEAELFSPDGAVYDRFGASVGISGDTAVIGAANTLAGPGTARVFTRSGSVWSQEQKLTDPQAVLSDQFGRGVGISGDTVVVAARGRNEERGAVFVFTRSGTTWTQQAMLEPDDAQQAEAFGSALAVSGDTVVVAARSSASQAGAVYVFERSDAAWTQQARLVPPDSLPYDAFGRSLAIDGDRLAVGCLGPGGDGVGSPGSVSLFRRTGLVWTLETKLLASDQANGDALGGAVGLSGGRVVAGAQAPTESRGSVYVFDTDAPAPPPAGYCLATKVKSKANAKRPEKSALTVSGLLDEGTSAANFDRPATFELGGFRLDVPQFVRKGKSLVYSAGGVSLKLTPQRDGLSHATFVAKAVGDFAGRVDLGQPLALRFATDLSDLRGSVDPTAVQTGLRAPELAVLGVKAVVKGAGEDTLQLTMRFDGDGLAPGVAGDLSFCFGASYVSPLVPAASFARKGATDVYTGTAPGITKAVVDHAKGTITIVGKGLDLSAFQPGGNLVDVTIVRNRLTRSVRVNLLLSGTKLSY